MADLGKTAEAGLAAEQAPYTAGPVLTQTSSRTRIEEHHDGEDEKLSRAPTADAEKDVEAATPEAEDTGLLTGFRLYAVFLALMMACFLFALDQSVSPVADCMRVMCVDKGSWRPGKRARACQNWRTRCGGCHSSLTRAPYLVGWHHMLPWYMLSGLMYRLWLLPFRSLRRNSMLSARLPGPSPDTSVSYPLHPWV